MASIRKLNGKWIAQVNKTGHPRVSKFFNSKSLARSWASSIEHEYNQINAVAYNKSLLNHKEMHITNLEIPKHFLKNHTRNLVAKYGDWYLSKYLYLEHKKLNFIIDIEHQNEISLFAYVRRLCLSHDITTKDLKDLFLAFDDVYEKRDYGLNRIVRFYNKESGEGIYAETRS